MTRTIVLLFWMILTANLAFADDRTSELFTAVEERNAAKVREILSADASLVNAKQKDASVVEAALFHVSKQGFVAIDSNDILQLVLSYKPRLDLFETAALGDAKELRRRLDARKDAITSRNHFGWSPLHFASFGGNSENVRLLLDRGADIHQRAKTRFRNTPLQIALLIGHYDTAKLLLERGADVLVRQNKGFTPMHEAALLGRVDLLQLLLDHGAEIGSRTDDGRTPLSEAIRGKHEEAVQFLKSKGAVVESAIVSSPDER